MSPLILFLIFFFVSNVAALGITIQPDTIAGEPSLVLWTRQPVDGGEQLTFDLRFVLPGPDPADIGLAMANIQASPSTQFGTVQVVFPLPGLYELVAVSGPGAINLGASGEVKVYAIPLNPTTSTTHTPISTPTSTSQIQPSATTPVQGTPTASGSSGVHHKKNLGAIIGGTLGGVAFLGLLAGLILFLRRRQPTDRRRWTFHRDLMIRPENAKAIRVITPTMTQSSTPLSPDVEQGLPHDITEPEVIMIASPNGSRPLIRPFIRPLPLPPAPLTDRQEALVKRMNLLRKEMINIERNAGPAQHIMLDDMQKQMTWLEDQIGSAWAMGLTDVTPLGFAHKVTIEYRQRDA